MKKFVILTFAVFVAFALAVSVSATGGLVRGAENVVGGAVRGVEDVVGGVARGAENVVGGVARGAENVVGNGNNHNNNHVAGKDKFENNNRVAAHTTHQATATAQHANNAHNRDRNPSTGVGLGLVEFAAIGTTLLGTTALAMRRRHK